MDAYKGISFLIILLLLTLSLNGQNINNRFDATYFEFEDFPSGRITSMAKDNNSFLWISTTVGLYRFDGREYRSYFYDKDTPGTLPSNLVYRNFVDSNDRLWLNGYSYDLAYLDKKSEQFIKLELEEYGDIGMYVYKFLEPSKNVMLILTGRGLIKMSFKSPKEYVTEVFFNDTRFLDASMDDKGKIWLTTDNGLFSINNIETIESSFKEELEFEGGFNTVLTSDNKIILSSHAELYVYTINREELKKIDLPDFEYSPGIYPQGIIKFDENKYWISIQCGILEFDAESETITNNITTIGNNLPEAGYSRLFNFKDNKIIAGFRKGIYLFDFNNFIFNNIGVFEQNDEFTEMGLTQSILVNGDDLWYGRHTGGLALQRDGKEYLFDIAKENGHFQKGYPQVLSIIKDHNANRIWYTGLFGLGYLDLADFNPENPVFHTFSRFQKDQFFFPAYNVNEMAIDSKGFIWAVARSHGLFRITETSPNRFKFKHFPSTSEIKNRRNTNSPTALVTNRDTLWLGTNGGLLKIVLDKDHDNILNTHHYYNSENTESVSSDHISDVTIDSQGQLWLATFSGLDLYLGNGKFKTWKDILDYKSPFIPAILSDNEDNIWMSTFGSGLIKFNSQNETFEIYGSEEGIKNKDWSSGKYIDDQGKLYFTGDYGITYFDPKRMDEVKQESRIYLSYLEGEKEFEEINTINFDEDSKQILNIRHNQFPVRLHFSALGYSNMSVESLYYRILPGNDSWSKMTGTDLQLVNLNSGNYTVEVNGSDFKGVWKQDPYLIQLNVIPPWWLSKLAYLFYGLIFVTSLVTLYKFLLSRKLALSESQRLKSVNEAMTSFYSNITHDFRTPLTVILGITKYLKTLEPNSNKDLKLIEKNASQLTHMVDNIIDLSKNEKGLLKKELIQADIISYLKYLIGSASTMAALKDVALTANFLDSELVMDFDKNYIKSIIGNLISNAIKFTPKGGEVNCLISTKGSSLQIVIEDSGIGMDKEELEFIFEKFYQSKNNLGTTEKGSGIGLALTKKYVEKLNGSVQVSSNLGTGSKFTVVLPITNNAQRTSISDSLVLENQIELKSNFLAIKNGGVEKPLILVIEDNEDVQYYLNICLKKDYNLIFADHGRAGINQAIQFIPDIIICDLMLPDIDGYKIMDKIKKDPRTDHIPIVMLTAKANKNSRLDGLKHGADAYLSKPFDENELFLVLQRLLDLRKKLNVKISENFSVLDKSESPNGNIEFIKRINSVIAKNLEDPEFGPKDISSQLNMSDSQLYRKIKALTNMSPIQFIRACKLHRAKILLKTTEKNISEIAYELGYTDPSYFTKIFKREFGYSPTAIKI